VVVINDHATKLSFPTNRLRFRRMHEQYLDLIDCVAFLRQFQKPEPLAVDEQDVAMANRMFKVVMRTSVDELKPPVRTTLDKIVRYGRKDFSRRELREALKMDNATLARHLNTLTELEYVKLLSGANGVKFVYERTYSENEEPSHDLFIGV
jgi:hypothetical protein